MNRLLSRIGVIVGALAALAGAGCASSNLSDKADLARRVSECLPVGTPAPSLIVRAVWYPKASGFASTDLSPNGNTTGLLVLAGSKLWFLQWDDELRDYDMVRSIDVPLVAKVSVSHFGSSEMLVVESHNMAFDSFELLNQSRLGSDHQTTQDLLQKLLALQSGQSQP